MLMLGAAGALCCLTAGTALGGWMRERRLCRLRMLRAEIEALGGMRLLLEQERPAMPDLLLSCAGYAPGGPGGDVVASRFTRAAQELLREPLSGLDAAYARACVQTPAPWERLEERAAMEMLFRQLGSGSAAMREQAAAACVRRLKPLEEAARDEAETGGKLCVQLGMLLGLMAGILLW